MTMSKKKLPDFYDPFKQQVDLSRFITSSTAANISFSGHMSHTHSPWHTPVISDLVDVDPDQVHMLKIVNYAEDYGQRNYEEELDWEILHSARCAKKVVSEMAYKHMHPDLRMDIYPPKTLTPSNVMNDTFDSFECPIAVHLRAHKGQLATLDTDWMMLDEGQYRIALMQSKQYVASVVKNDYKSCVLRLL